VGGVCVPSCACALLAIGQSTDQLTLLQTCSPTAFSWSRPTPLTVRSCLCNVTDYLSQIDTPLWNDSRQQTGQRAHRLHPLGQSQEESLHGDRTGRLSRGEAGTILSGLTMVLGSLTLNGIHTGQVRNGDHTGQHDRQPLEQV